MTGILKKLDSIKVGSAGSILACETDGFKLRGAVVTSSVTGMNIGLIVESRALDFRQAVDDLIAQLEEKGEKVPKKSILVTPSAVQALLELPVNPATPRPDQQMQELVRWELEPLFGQQNDIWSLGALLMGRGYINAQQRAAAVKEYHNRTEQGGKRINIPFGEVLLSMSQVTREQVDECLALQEKLILVNDDLICGWAPQITQEDLIGDEGELFRWHGVGAGRAMCTAWVKAFRANGISLDWIYPQLGCAFASLNESQTGRGEQMLLEIRQEQIAVFRGNGGELADVRTIQVTDGHPNADEIFGLIQDQLHPDVHTLYVFAPRLRTNKLAEYLSHRSGRKVMGIDKASPSSKGSLASLMGAAAHHLGRIPANTLARLKAQPPKPALWKRRELYPYAAAIAILLAVVGFDLSMHIERWKNEVRLVELDAQFEEKMALKKKVESQASEAMRLEKEIAKRSRTLTEVNKKNQIIENILIQRQKSVPGILRTLAKTSGDEIILDGLSESDKSPGIRVTGWALTDTGAELFLNRLNQALEKWEMLVTDSQVVADRGRTGLDGYGIDLWLVPRINPEVSQ